MELSEIQYFRSLKALPFYLLVLGTLLILIYTFLKASFEPTSMLLSIGVSLLVLLLLFFCKLQYAITPSGIKYRFFPFHFNTYEIPIADIRSARVRKFNAFSEFLGWGLRRNLKGDVAYCVFSDNAIELTLQGGKKIIFSTQIEPERIIETFKKLNFPVSE